MRRICGESVGPRVRPKTGQGVAPEGSMETRPMTKWAIGVTRSGARHATSTTDISEIFSAAFIKWRRISSEAL